MTDQLDLGLEAAPCEHCGGTVKVLDGQPVRFHQMGCPILENQIARQQGETAPYQPHSAESKAAAHEIEPHLGRLQAEILGLIRLSGVGGVTDNELIQLSGRGGSTVRPRRIELMDKGLIRKAGFTRPTETGRQAAVWVAL